MKSLSSLVIFPGPTYPKSPPLSLFDLSSDNVWARASNFFLFLFKTLVILSAIALASSLLRVIASEALKDPWYLIKICLDCTESGICVMPITFEILLLSPNL